MRSNIRKFAVLAAGLTLASCGGGGGDGSSGGSSGGGGGGSGSGGAPTISTNGDISVAEDMLDPVQLTANVSGASFRLSGGADEGLFDQSGNVFQFRIPISFETPLDADGDNVYEVELEVSAGGQSSRKLFRITITDSKEGIETSRLVDGLGTIVAADQHGFDKVVMVRADASLVVYDLTENRLTELGTPFGLGTGHDAVLAIGSIDTGVERKFMVAADRNAGEVVLLYYRDGLASAPVELETVPFTDPGEIWVSIAGSLVALGDNGSKEAAWDQANAFGNIRYFRESSLSFDFYANGFHRPVMGVGLQIDQGEVYDEATMTGSFNYGWGQFDGFEPTGWTPPNVQATQSPLFALAKGNGPLESGGLIGSTTPTFVADDLSDEMVIDRNGRIFTYSQIYAQDWGTDGVERRDADFAPDVGAIDQPVLLALLDDQPTGGTLEFPVIVDRDGEIFIVR